MKGPTGPSSPPDGPILGDSEWEAGLRARPWQGRQQLRGHTRKITCLSFEHHQDQTILLSGSDDQTICVWNLHSPLCAEPTCKQTTHSLCDGGFLCSHKTVCFRKPQFILQGHTGAITNVQGQSTKERFYIISASADCTVRMWDGSDGSFLWSHSQHTAAVTHLSCYFGAGLRLVACGAENGRIHVFKVEEGCPSVADDLEDEGSRLVGLWLGRIAGGYRMISCFNGAEGVEARVFDLEEKAIVTRTRLCGHLTGPVGFKKIVNQHSYYIFGDNTVQLWDATTGAAKELIRINPIPGKSAICRFTDVLESHHGSLLLCSQCRQPGEEFDVRERRYISEFKPSTGHIRHSSPVGRWLHDSYGVCCRNEVTKLLPFGKAAYCGVSSTHPSYTSSLDPTPWEKGRPTAEQEFQTAEKHSHRFWQTILPGLKEQFPQLVTESDGFYRLDYINSSVAPFPFRIAGVKVWLEPADPLDGGWWLQPAKSPVLNLFTHTECLAMDKQYNDTVIALSGSMTSVLYLWQNPKHVVKEESDSA